MTQHQRPKQFSLVRWIRKPEGDRSSESSFVTEPWSESHPEGGTSAMRACERMGTDASPDAKSSGTIGTWFGASPHSFTSSGRSEPPSRIYAA